MHLAKDQFRIELLHLQVYSENPAIHLYERMGFKEFGRQIAWIKERRRSVYRTCIYGKIFVINFHFSHHYTDRTYDNINTKRFRKSFRNEA